MKFKLHFLLVIFLLSITRVNFCNYKFIKKFQEVTLEDISLVGGKNASLGQMIGALSSYGIRVPHGFAVTVGGYNYYMNHNQLTEKISLLLSIIDNSSGVKLLKRVSNKIRNLIENSEIPSDLAEEITSAYQELSDFYECKNCDVAVRSSATAEDLPDASFAGQQDTYLNVQGVESVLKYYKKCISSLFTDRAISYRIEKGFDQLDVALSVGIQKMIRSDLASSGVAFSIDTETGFKDAIIINSSYGLGEGIVQGMVTPDEYVVHKPTFSEGYASIIKKQLGSKLTKVVYGNKNDSLIRVASVSKKDQEQFSLTEKDVLDLSKMVMLIEKHYSEVYSKRNEGFTPIDIEWAKDGIDGEIYILQARPETVHAGIQKNVLKTYSLGVSRKSLVNKIIVKGVSVGEQITTGIAKVIESIEDVKEISENDIIVTNMTDPDWIPIMKQAKGIITNNGGRTCHAAVVSRELGIPAVVGTQNATEKIKDGQKITLDCSGGNVGYIFSDHIPFDVSEVALDTIGKPPVEIMVNIADPDSAFKASFLPTSGIGLVRLEFIISNALKIHPMALLHPEKVTDSTVIEKMNKMTSAYDNKPDFFVDQLACSVGMMAAAFYPRPIIVRFSDLKSNEYRNLIGGSFFEPLEENPMIGFRGASRYYHPAYQKAFALECKAMKIVREKMGLKNVKLMIPFVRTVKEAAQVIEEMKKNGLERGKNGLEVIMMCELPCNVMLMEEFSKYFDGFSIGSNDLTQTTLGIDRDSALIAPIFDERNEAVKKMLIKSLKTANKLGTYIGICGQAPSDFPDLAEFLIENGIHSLSLTPDTVIPFMMRYSK